MSFKSWGSFDIVILQRIGEARSIGIQVKRTQSGVVELEKKERERLLLATRKLSLVPVLAIVKDGEVAYTMVREGVKKYSISGAKRALKELMAGAVSEGSGTNGEG